MKTKKIEDLNQIYEQTISATKDLFSEQRSNTMLVAGNHYSGKSSGNWDRIRDMQNVPSEQKLRLTKNHIRKITNAYVNNLISSSPSVKVTPRDEKSNQSRKSAQLNDAVWQYAVDTLEMPIINLSLAQDFIEIGEVAIKCFFNPTVGKIISFNQAVGDNGEPEIDEQGQPKQGTPNYQGMLQIEQILATNLGVDINCTKFNESPWVWVRKMMPYDQVKALVGNDKDKMKMVQEDKKESTMIFDPSVADYSVVKGQVLIVEYYFRPCHEYPKGYYYITTKNGILFEGELPFGIFPIEYVGFDRIQANPRHKSIIKQLRPYQLEINRSASKIAEHQITSDDKLLVQSGTKLSSGSTLAGNRVIQFTGIAPTYLEGRNGSQYLEYLSQQIQEMYQVANLLEDAEMKPIQGADPYGLLFRSVKEQKKFVVYTEKFEHFLKRICKLYLSLAKEYLEPEDLIPMIGKSEYVNIAEFKTTQDIEMNIKVIPMTDDVNTMWGKWLTSNHMLQYSSAQLGKTDIAQVARNMPYGNFEEAFSDIMLDYDLSQNLMLAVERGEQPQVSPADNKQYMLKKIENRMRQADFAMLTPEVQQVYGQLRQQYTELMAQEAAQLQQAQAGFIPTSGPLIRTDLKTEVPNASGGMKTVSKSFPIEALSWLEKKMQDQGASLETLMQLPQSSQAGVASELNKMNPQAQQMPSGGNLQQPNVAAQPQGANNVGEGTNPFAQFARR